MLVDTVIRDRRYHAIIHQTGIYLVQLAMIALYISSQTFANCQSIEESLTIQLLNYSIKSNQPQISLASPIRPVWVLRDKPWLETLPAGRATWGQGVRNHQPLFSIDFCASPPRPLDQIFSRSSLSFLIFSIVPPRWPFLLCPGHSRAMSSSPKTRWHPPP